MNNRSIPSSYYPPVNRSERTRSKEADISLPTWVKIGALALSATAFATLVPIFPTGSSEATIGYGTVSEAAFTALNDIAEQKENPEAFLDTISSKSIYKQSEQEKKYLSQIAPGSSGEVRPDQEIGVEVSESLSSKLGLWGLRSVDVYGKN
jgi:hypothetical protein